MKKHIEKITPKTRTGNEPFFEVIDLNDVVDKINEIIDHLEGEKCGKELFSDTFNKYYGSHCQNPKPCPIHDQPRKVEKKGCYSNILCDGRCNGTCDVYKEEHGKPRKLEVKHEDDAKAINEGLDRLYAPQESWEKEFDKKFKDPKYINEFKISTFPNVIKSFISTLLTKTRQEERKECVGRIVKKINECNHRIKSLSRDLRPTALEILSDLEQALKN